MGAEQAYFVKGYLLDKDPPKLVLDALDDIIDAFKGGPDYITKEYKPGFYYTGPSAEPAPRHFTQEEDDRLMKSVVDSLFKKETDIKKGGGALDFKTDIAPIVAYKTATHQAGQAVSAELAKAIIAAKESCASDHAADGLFDVTEEHTSMTKEEVEEGYAYGSEPEKTERPEENEAETHEELESKPEKRKLHKWTEEEKQDIVRMRAAGRTFKQIGEATGIDAPKCTALWYGLRAKDELGKYEIAHSPEKSSAPKPAAYKPVTSDKLIEDHSDFAGEREDGILQDHDWGDIKKQLMQGDDQAKVATRYGCSRQEMSNFISRMQAGAPAAAPKNADLNKMELMRKRGKTDEQIAAEMNISVVTVRYMLRASNPKPKPKTFSFASSRPEPDPFDVEEVNF